MKELLSHVPSIGINDNGAMSGEYGGWTRTSHLSVSK